MRTICNECDSGLAPGTTPADPATDKNRGNKRVILTGFIEVYLFTGTGEGRRGSGTAARFSPGLKHKGKCRMRYS